MRFPSRPAWRNIVVSAGFAVLMFGVLALLDLVMHQHWPDGPGLVENALIAVIAAALFLTVGGAGYSRWGAWIHAATPPPVARSSAQDRNTDNATG